MRRRHPLWAWWLLAVLPGAQALELRDNRDALPPLQAARAGDVQQQAMARLPPGVKAALPARIDLRWTQALPGHVAGRAHGPRVQLQRSLLDDPGAAADAAAVAALLHELVHVADRGPRGGWSRQPYLRELAGWQRRPWRLGRTANQFTARSPDRYELDRPAEYLAVNVEHWLQDADYACRRPAMAAWLRDTFGAPPFPAQAACADAVPLLAAGASEGALELLQLAPERVYAIDYLHAERGEQVMSRWGHTMLRLVICRPGRPRGPDCRLDLQYHRVLSFRAFVGDVQLSGWQGLTGGYPSRLFVLPLQQVIDEYTQVELRGLASLPLRLDPAQIAGVIERAAQLNWAYDGRYYFLGNNCAVETAKLLQAAIPSLQQAGIERITPAGVRRRLVRAGWLDESVLADRTAATAQGYYFASADQHYAQLFAAARGELALPAGNARQWLALDARTRAPWLQRGTLRASAGLLLLEQAAYRRAELRARAQLKKNWAAAPDSEPAQRLQQLLQASGQWLQPGTVLAGPGYGLPQPDELQHLVPRLARVSAEAPEAWRALRAQLQDALPPAERDELTQTADNLERLGQRLRRQAQPDAGTGTPP